MAAQRTTDPGVATGADIYEVINHNADELDNALNGFEVTGNGAAEITRVNGESDQIEIPLSPDGVYAGLVGSVSGLVVSVTEGRVQRDGQWYDLDASTLTLSPNPGGPDRIDLVYLDTTGEAPALRVQENIPGLTPAVLAGKLALYLAFVPTGENGTLGSITLATLNRMSGDAQQLPTGADPNDMLAAWQATEEGGTIWQIAGKSERVAAEEFAAQWYHHGGTLYISPGPYYDGLSVLTLPENPGKGWHIDLVDVATLIGAEDGSALLIEARGEDAPLVNGGGSFELEPGWIGARVHFDGEQYLVIANSFSL